MNLQAYFIERDWKTLQTVANELPKYEVSKIGNELMMYAVRGGNVGLLNTLVKNEVIDKNFNDGIDPVGFALMYKDWGMVKSLIKSGFSVTKEIGLESGVDTALNMAVRMAPKEIVELILEKEPSLLNQDLNKKTWTPLMYALRNGNKEMTDFLLDRGADIGYVSDEGITPLMVATNNAFDDSKAFDSFLEKIKVLNPTERKELLNKQSNKGETALMIAATHGQDKICKKLLELGANPDLINKDGETAISIAKKGTNESHKKVLDVIVNFIKGDANFNDIKKSIGNKIREARGLAWENKAEVKVKMANN